MLEREIRVQEPLAPIFRSTPEPEFHVQAFFGIAPQASPAFVPLLLCSVGEESLQAPFWPAPTLARLATSLGSLCRARLDPDSPERIAFALRLIGRGGEPVLQAAHQTSQRLGCFGLDC